jgi:hypothetical protein
VRCVKVVCCQQEAYADANKVLFSKRLRVKKVRKHCKCTALLYLPQLTLWHLRCVCNMMGCDLFQHDSRALQCLVFGHTHAVAHGKQLQCSYGHHTAASAVAHQCSR